MTSYNRLLTKSITQVLDKHLGVGQYPALLLDDLVKAMLGITGPDGKRPKRAEVDLIPLAQSLGEVCSLPLNEHREYLLQEARLLLKDHPGEGVSPDTVRERYSTWSGWFAAYSYYTDQPGPNHRLTPPIIRTTWGFWNNEFQPVLPFYGPDNADITLVSPSGGTPPNGVVTPVTPILPPVSPNIDQRNGANGAGNDKPKRPATKHQLLTGAVARVCKQVVFSYAAKTASDLERGYRDGLLKIEPTPELVTLLYSDEPRDADGNPQSWWYTVLCKNGTYHGPPSPNGLARTFGQAVEYYLAGLAAKKQDKSTEEVIRW